MTAPTRLRFTKMHGQGNDFVMLNGIEQKLDLSTEQIRFIADRHFGIGCDQILIVEAPTRSDADFKYRIFNASGEEVEHCGNGSRCFPFFVRDEGLTTKTKLRVQTMNGLIVPSINDDGTATVDMGAPRFKPADIPFQADAEAIQYAIEVDGKNINLGVVSMGNPHAVQVVVNVDTAPVIREGPKIEHHVRFPQRVNVGYMQIISRGQIALRVWERGAGETLACGTGACAAVVTGIRWGLLDETVIINTRGGELTVRWQGAKDVAAPVMMSGAATTVFRGEITI
jgi:diaminopimelate epimerase